MKVLVSTHKGQGLRKSDFCWCRDGELLYLGFECDHTGGPDGSCGCQRSFCGMDHHAATTTGEVVEVDGSQELYLEGYVESMKRAGWIKEGNGLQVEEFEQEGREFLEVVDKFRVGDILEKRGDIIQVRDLHKRMESP